MNRVPATRGFAWIAGSLALVRKQPSRLLLMGLVLQFLTGITQAGPLGFLFVMAIPALTAGILQAMYLASLGHRPPLTVLFSAFSIPQRLLRLFALSLVMLAAGMLAAGGLLSGSMAGLDPALLTRLERGDMSALSSVDPELLRQMALSVLAGVLASGMVGYFSIPLVWFGGQSTGMALLNGLAGVFRNVLPLLVLAACMVLLAMPVGFLAAMLMSASGGSNLLTLVVLFLIVAYQLVLFGAQYLSFRDLFGVAPQEPGSGTENDQFVA